LASVLRKARFWDAHAGDPLNDRQRKVVNRLLDGFEGKLSSSKYAALAKCSQDTAARDIDDLQDKAILVRDPAGGRSTRYSLVADSADALGALARWIESQADKAGGAERALPLRALSQDVRDRAGSADGKKFQVWLSALATLEAKPEDRLVSLVARVLEADVTRLGAAGGKD
jgi:hypothetical protein